MFGILIFFLGIVAIIALSFNAFKTANDSERNALAWTALVAVAGLSIQIILPILLFILIAISLSVGLVTEQGLDSAVFLTLIIQLFSVVVSVGVMLTILNYLGKIPEEDVINSVPPPPTDFNLR